MNRPLRLRSPIANVLLLALLGLSNGCDSGSPRAGSKGPSQAAVRLTGHVLNDDGPITAAKIEAQDASGAVAARTEISGDSVYTLTIPPGARYPLVLIAYPEGGADPVKAAVSDAAAREQDISAVTTIVVDTALSLGGINETNLAKAAGAAIAQRRKSGGGGGGGGQTSESFKGDPTKQYGGWH